MKITLLWHGSEAAGIDHTAGSVRLRLSAAHVLCAGGDTAGLAQDGHLCPLALTFHGARVSGDVAGALGSLASGVLRHRGHALGQVTLPLMLDGGVSAELVFHNGTVLEIEADAAECRPGPQSRFRESLAC